MRDAHAATTAAVEGGSVTPQVAALLAMGIDPRVGAPVYPDPRMLSQGHQQYAGTVQVMPTPAPFGPPPMPLAPQLGPAGHFNGHANGAAPAAPTGKTERLERTAVAIACAAIRTGTYEQFQTGASSLAIDSVRAARALLDEIDGVISRS